jgi:biotin carboxylase
MSLSERILFIGGTRRGLEKAGEPDLSVTFIQEPARFVPETLLLCDELHMMEIGDHALVEELAALLHRHDPFQAVVSFGEAGMLPAALVARRLGLHQNPPEVVTLTNDKAALRRRLAEAGFPPVAFRHCRDQRDARLFAAQNGLPIILKPADSSGSLGVTLVARDADIPPAFAAAARYSSDGSALAEEYLEGPEVSVEALTLDGVHHLLTVTDKETTGPPHFVETGHTVPSRLPRPVQAEVLDTARRLLEAVGQRFGASHTELRWTAAGPRVVETHARPGGDQIPFLVELALGVDMEGACLRRLLGRAAVVESPGGPAAKGAHGAAAVRFFRHRPGRVLRIEGADEARRMPGMVKVEVRVEVGMDVPEMTDTWTRLGFVVAVGPTPEEAARRAEVSRDAVAITISRATPTGRPTGRSVDEHG